ncbi:glycosyltransferase family 2 protein [Pontibacter oryzae]|nr:glycosyltransferase family 2 protein [Pontibacter oryzae]
MEQKEHVREWPMVSIISINYNGLQYTLQLLESLEQVSYPNFEVIIVDNASHEDPSEIERSYPHVKLLRSKENLGFAGGNNLGLDLAKGEYYLLLNNDTEVEPGFLEPLVSTLEGNPSIGAASAKLVFHHSPGVLQYAGSTPINPFTGRGKSIGFGEQDSARFSRTEPTARAHGAAMLLPARVVEKVGKMPEMYFLYYEEMDYCAMINKAGYEIWYVGSSRVWHKESMAVGRDTPLKTYYMTRNRLLYLRRNVQGPVLWLSVAYFCSIAAPKNLLQFALKRRFDLLRACWRGMCWHLMPHKYAFTR